MISAEAITQAQFYDVDATHVVWHGNYARFLELARCALMEKIGYSYPEMARSGYLWPIVELRIKYVRPVRMAQQIRLSATLLKYENRLRIDYRIVDAANGGLLSKARMNLRARCFVVCCVSWILGALGSGWAGPPVEGTARLREGQILRGHFEQERHLEGFQAPVKSTGTFLLVPGRGLVWRTEAPFAVTTVISP